MYIFYCWLEKERGGGVMSYDRLFMQVITTAYKSFELRRDSRVSPHRGSESSR